MKLAHLILAHASHKHLERLINRLQNANADVYIHIDKNVDINSFANLQNIKNVYFINNRIVVRWGDYNMIQATLNSFEEIIAKGINYSHINLLSSQDYPLKSAAEIQNFLFANADKTYMRYLRIPEEWNEPLNRLTKYSFGDYEFPGKHQLQNLANKLLPDRKPPQNMVIYGRSQWFTITPEAATYAINYLKTNNPLRRFFRRSWAADEFVFQTVLLNSPLKDKVVNDHLRYIKFKPADSRPQTLTIIDAGNLTASAKYYARKFDSNADSCILDYLDNFADVLCK